MGHSLLEFQNLIYTTSTAADDNLSFSWGKEEDVIKNRGEFLTKLGIKPEECVGMSLCHGDQVKVVGRAQCGTCMLGPESCLTADALVTKDTNVFLFLLTADCLPVAYYDQIQQVIALAHLSWINTGKNLAGKVVNVMNKQFNSRPVDIIVSIGPHIHKESYEHNHPEQKEDPNWQPFIEKLPNEQFLIDMLSYNRKNLLAEGILGGNLNISEINTYTSPDYFSHYRSKRTGEPEGRFATVLGVRQS
jgi:YfiH family protein